MEFYIGRNTTLPLLKLQIVKDGRVDYEKFNELIEGSTIYFSMIDSDTGVIKSHLSKAGFVNKVFDDPNTPTEYYVYYRFSKKDTNKIGRFEGQFLLKSDFGSLILPIREQLFINVTDSSQPYISEESNNPLINNVNIYAIYYGGSIQADYIIQFQYPVPFDVVFSFTNILGTFEGDEIIIPVSLTISGMTTSATTSVSVSGDYTKLNQKSFFRDIRFSTGADINFSFTTNSSFEFTTTPTPTPTPSFTVTPTITPSSPFCPSYELIATPYSAPSAGKTLFTDNQGLNLSGITNPNTFGQNGVMWSLIDRYGNDLLSYYSQLISNDFIITFKQNTNIVQYSGIAGSLTLVNLPQIGLYYVYHDEYNEPLSLTLSSDTNFNLNEYVCISYEIPPSQTPTPTPTETPVSTQNPRPNPSPTPTSTPSIDQLIDPIIIGNQNEYILVGNELYLKFIDPE